MFSLQLASERATSIGLVLVLFLFFDKVRERDTTIFLQHVFAFIYVEMTQSVHFNTSIALSFHYLLVFPFYFL